MTDEQRAELEQLEVAIAAHPDDADALHKRTRLLDATDCDFERLVRAYNEYYAKTAGHHWKNKEHAAHIRRQAISQACRGWKASLDSKQSAHYRRSHRAQSVALWTTLLENTRGIEKWLAGRTRSAAYLLSHDQLYPTMGAEWLEESGFAPHDELDEATLCAVWKWCATDLELRALGASISHGVRMAAHIYGGVLQCHFKSGRLKNATKANCLRQSRQKSFDLHRQLAWLNLAINNAPDDATLWIKRARWLSENGEHNASRTDFARAIALRPNDPTYYEARAGCAQRERYWDTQRDNPSVAQDYAQALRLRIAAGELPGDWRALKACADKMMRTRRKRRNNTTLARVYALYTLALEQTPNATALYVARAHSLETDFYRHPHLPKGYSRTSASRRAAYEDYLRALVLNLRLVTPRAAAIRFLCQTLVRPTAHQRMEALLAARQDLIHFGVKPELINAILAEVERALAA